MPSPKIPPVIKAELQAMGLTVWTCSHPITFDYEAPGGLKPRGRADTGVIDIHLAGPGVEGNAMGRGRTVREAVDEALARGGLLDRVGGLKGAVGRLGAEVGRLRWTMMATAHRVRNGISHDGMDDDVPF